MPFLFSSKVNREQFPPLMRLSALHFLLGEIAAFISFCLSRSYAGDGGVCDERSLCAFSLELLLESLLCSQLLQKKIL